MRRIRTLAVLATAVASFLVVSATPSLAIADGIQATTGQFPFAVKLVMTGVQKGTTTYDSGCSGALISPTWIITAGHCFHDANGNRVSGPPPYASTTATFNTVDVGTDPGESYSVVDVEQSSTADIALAQLSGTTAVAPLHLSTRKPPRGQILDVAGWGATSSVNPAPSDQLYWGQVKVSGVTSSTVSVVGYYPARDTSACLYDSGAPYFTTGATPLLVSTESNGPNCPHTSAETTARVDNVVPWISGVVTDLPK